ncbi:malate synthase G [Octadecabacter sp. 1_MG-2023]|uniref:malate synthase G n=1 Tax=unclassified Octadecabacter TaxID=196158 RepID=UPI001C097FBA|nr:MULTISPECIES: malate synthase G [unclassified Octadecabacter]MBU2992965.1 malate synthase G [Octadecabacter sp. B2R22]MDO6733583.1 malate synthase G [Octadecabacter sp. 1_MG-2023]
MTNRVTRGELSIAAELVEFIEQKALPETGVTADAFWQGFSDLINDFGPENKALLEVRSKMQSQIDDWHKARIGTLHNEKAYDTFLREIGYLVPDGDDFEIETTNVDPEIAKVPGPQLVVPITNARFALNAANARWGSLYDGFYGTDAMGRTPKGKGYDRGHGSRVVARTRVFLDDTFPIEDASHGDVEHYTVVDGALLIDGNPLMMPKQFVGYTGDPAKPKTILLKNHGLHVELVFDANHVIGSHDRASLADVRLESAVSAIMDCEDSVACVDAEDKVVAYTNWLGLMRGDLESTFEKDGKTMTRRLHDDRTFTTPEGGSLTLKGRALLWVRNVGHLMTNPAILDRDGNEAFEGLMDAMITTLIAKHDLARDSGNSVHGSVYIVKPKMHGPDEVAFTNRIFSHVETVLNLPANTIKVGIMDEERRTSANLKECIRAAKSRVAFINTGFLDRTGDEIHTSMEAGPVSRKDFIKRKGWIGAYENQNVDIGLECGLSGRAQIGKGMWAMPDDMAGMIEQKVDHPKAGANCAWVPSPTAATLHALHYHKIDVFAVQAKLKAGGRRSYLPALLEIPLASYRAWTDQQITREVENNAQGILGYVVRWIDQGMGASKVPDINNIPLMEDRATCRISAQHIANWLHHDIIDRGLVMTAMHKMAAVVDEQNADDKNYTPMAPDFGGIAFQAACDLIFMGREQPSGYTEPVLHRRRLELKARDNV